jgi:hypothetical protein
VELNTSQRGARNPHRPEQLERPQVMSARVCVDVHDDRDHNGDYTEKRQSSDETLSRPSRF